MKLSNWLAISVLVPKILLMDTTLTTGEQLDLNFTKTGNKIIYYDIEMELVEIPDCPPLMDVEDSGMVDTDND